MATLNVSVGRRLAISFGLILGLLLLLVVIAWLANRQIEEIETHRDTVVRRRAELAQDLRVAVLKQSIEIRSYELTGAPQYLEEFRQDQAAGQAALLGLAPLPKDPNIRPLYERSVELVSRFNQTAERLIVPAPGRASRAANLSMESELGSIREELLQTLDQFHDAHVRKLAEVAAVTRELRIRVLSELIGIAFGVALLSLATAIFTTRSIRGGIQRLTSAAQALGRGDFQAASALRPRNGAATKLTSLDEFRMLGDRLGWAGEELQYRQRLQDAELRVSKALAATIDVPSISAATLSEMVDYARCEVGALYVADDDGIYRRAAAHGLSCYQSEIRVGDGILGEAAAGRSVVVRDLPADAPFSVHFGFDSLPPRTLVALPIPFQNETVGVVTLGSIRVVDERAIEFLERSAERLGIGLRNALTHRRVEQLVVELEEKNTELVAQYEELQAQNEEIQSQTEELQGQNDEILALNESLYHHSEQVEQLNREIEARLGDLERQREALLEADLAKDRFLSIAAHELKTPVTSIKGFSQLLARRVDSGKVALADLRAMVGRIDLQADIISQRINRLLNAGRVRTGKLELQPELVDIVQLVRQQVEHYLLRSGAHNIVVDCDADAIVGYWDQGYLEQVIGNLVDNAIRYSPAGGEIRVDLSVVNGSAVFSVADRGIGIPAEAQARLFQPYFRDGSAQAVSNEGMGVGLYITREIVTLHGGSITFESAVGQGTTFSVTLPLTPASLADLELVSSSAAVAHGASVDAGRVN